MNFLWTEFRSSQASEIGKIFQAQLPRSCCTSRGGPGHKFQLTYVRGEASSSRPGCSSLSYCGSQLTERSSPGVGHRVGRPPGTWSGTYIDYPCTERDGENGKNWKFNKKI